MAEVPEVETIVRDLREAVVGRTIARTEVLLPAAVRFPGVDEFINVLTDRTVLESNRRAKYILLPLSGDLLLAVHFALWGTLALVPTEQTRLPETLIIWHLDQGQDLRLIDKLGYARAAVGEPGALIERLDLDSLG
ncbi:MAG TPA: DNA-formamidopyrimidine glycosylase family protein, partial [Anaerolineales bacterium]|nr:DNA-formamidopyrimidine glycosylase family protein [Anaerolineales bacterium]